MNIVRLLEKRFGGWWTGIVFHTDCPQSIKLSSRPMKFCEAIRESRKGPIFLTEELLDCPGGRRSLGWSACDDELARAMANKTGIDLHVTKEAIKNTSRLQNRIVAVTIGTYNSPDVVVSYAQPEDVMKFLRKWQQIHGFALRTEFSSFMAICGSVAVKAHLTGQVCFSFGCPDSRKHGNIGRDRLVIGMPFCSIAELFQGESRSVEARL